MSPNTLSQVQNLVHETIKMWLFLSAIALKFSDIHVQEDKRMIYRLALDLASACILQLSR